MKSESIAITYQLKFESAFHCGTGLRGGIVHRLVARDAADYLYIPGSSLKGVLRNRCEQLARSFGLRATPPHPADLREASPNPEIIARIFGSRFLPGTVYYDDAHMLKEDQALFTSHSTEARVRELRGPALRATQTEKRTQVSISRATGTASSGMLFTSEYGIRDLRFEGRIVGVLEGTPLDESPVGTYALMLLLAGLLSLDSIGGGKSAGAGKLKSEILGLTVDGQPMEVESILGDLPWLELYPDLHEEEAL